MLGVALTWRALTAHLKSVTMGVFRVFVLGPAAWSAATGTVPEPKTMGVIGTLALLAQLSMAACSTHGAAATPTCAR